MVTAVAHGDHPKTGAHAAREDLGEELLHLNRHLTWRSGLGALRGVDERDAPDERGTRRRAVEQLERLLHGRAKGGRRRVRRDGRQLGPVQRPDNPAGEPTELELAGWAADAPDDGPVGEGEHGRPVLVAMERERPDRRRRGGRGQADEENGRRQRDYRRTEPHTD